MISRQGFRLIKNGQLILKAGQLLVSEFRRCGGGGFDAGPTSDKFVVGAGVFGLAEAFAQGVEAVGELAHGFGFAAQGGEECAGGGFAALFKGTDELVQGLPDGRAGVGARVPIGGILGPLEQAHFAAAALQHPGFLQARRACR